MIGYHPDTGKPIRKYTYANTREEAAYWIALTLVSETSKAAPSLASELLLKDFLHRWLTTFKTYEVCSRTMELYYSCERLHIVPALGDIPVAALTASRIQTLLYYLQAEKQLSRRTISLVRSILIQLYDYLGVTASSISWLVGGAIGVSVWILQNLDKWDLSDAIDNSTTGKVKLEFYYLQSSFEPYYQEFKNFEPWNSSYVDVPEDYDHKWRAGVYDY